MANYLYKARDSFGKQVRGTLEGESKQDVVDKLRRMGYMATQVTQAIGAGINLSSAPGRIRRISFEDMIMFYIQLANMIEAGISIMISLITLSKQTENKKLKEIIGDISRGVEAGESFSQALSHYPKVFSKLFMNMVKTGEASGKLGLILRRFAEFSEYQIDLNQKIKGALFYPIILLCAGIAVTLFVVTFIIPQFAQIFIKAGIALPLPTLFLYKAGITIKNYWYIIILSGIIAVSAIKYYLKTKTGRLAVDKLKLNLFIFGSLFRKGAISKFSRTLATLVGSGVPILECLDITAEVVDNEVIALTVRNARNSVEKGESISQTLKISEEFPADAVQMIATGEETGKLEAMLEKIAQFYDMSLGYTIKKMTTVLEPLLLVIMGGVIGFIMASMLLPMFDMMKMLRH